MPCRKAFTSGIASSRRARRFWGWVAGPGGFQPSRHKLIIVHVEPKSPRPVKRFAEETHCLSYSDEKTRSARPRTSDHAIIAIRAELPISCPAPTALLDASLPFRTSARDVARLDCARVPWPGRRGWSNTTPLIGTQTRPFQSTKLESLEMRAVHKLAMLSLVWPAVELSLIIGPHNSRRLALLGRNAGCDLREHLLLPVRGLRRRRAAFRVQHHANF